MKKHTLSLIPNVLTVFRISLVPFFVLTLFRQKPASASVALVLFAVAALTDYFDGFLARKLQTQTGIGEFLDPLADKLLVGGAFVSFSFIPELGIPLWLVLIILLREAAVTLLRVIAIKHGASMKTELGGKIKTAVQMFSISVILVLFFLMRTSFLSGQIMGWSPGSSTISDGDIQGIWELVFGACTGRIIRWFPLMLVSASATVSFFSMLQYILKNRSLLPSYILLKAFSTIFFIGYIPFARGTWASLFACLLWMVFSESICYPLITLGVIIAGFPFSHYAEKLVFQQKDSSRIVIDEFGGMLLALMCFRFSFSVEGVLLGTAGFVIFRILDILKPWPLSGLEKVRGGAGIMLDDLVSGTITNALLQIVRFMFFKGMFIRYF
ncbi:MAG: CDP-diacylglycerol--glycerol-3-phosphate 3-phosphatidyltransferase [Spirochaetota bacterium]